MGEKSKLWRLHDLGIEAFSREVKADFPKHSHDEWQIARTARGVNRWWHRHAFYDTTPENLTVIPPGDVHGAYKASKPPWSLETLYIPDLAFRRALVEWETSSGGDTPAHPVLDDARVLAWFGMFWDVATDASSSLERTSAFSGLVAGLATRGIVPDLKQPTLGPEADAVGRAREFLHAHPEREVSLAELAEIARIGPFRLAREFCRVVGVPPHAYQIQLRVRRAEMLLLEGAEISEAAQLSGFADQGHLGRHFRKQLAISPGHYRRAARTF